MVTEKTRQADEKLREELRNADMKKFKRLITPALIEKRDAKKPREKRIERSARPR